MLWGLGRSPKFLMVDLVIISIDTGTVYTIKFMT